ncbi:hypothetical protein OIY81_2855 [Cryptosporidium canis]|uniref:Uncharacterized protein n=1 Tax=Cryptosporidium canis TaxID=195482 RepID=A0ABQ8P2J1_9CRYT|nr:hypothetical protein OJ252_3523 [Cryptosporidium canis]KAJ1607726.1 hypothetical protein OIY81_2855 [Cryptosporidium canis]
MLIYVVYEGVGCDEGDAGEGQCQVAESCCGVCCCRSKRECSSKTRQTSSGALHIPQRTARPRRRLAAAFGSCTTFAWGSVSGGAERQGHQGVDGEDLDGGVDVKESWAGRQGRDGEQDQQELEGLQVKGEVSEHGHVVGDADNKTNKENLNSIANK